MKYLSLQLNDTCIFYIPHGPGQLGLALGGGGFGRGLRFVWRDEKGGGGGGGWGGGGNWHLKI